MGFFYDGFCLTVPSCVGGYLKGTLTMKTLKPYWIASWAQFINKYMVYNNLEVNSVFFRQLGSTMMPNYELHSVVK